MGVPLRAGEAAVWPARAGGAADGRAVRAVSRLRPSLSPRLYDVGASSDLSRVTFLSLSFPRRRVLRVRAVERNGSPEPIAEAAATIATDPNAAAEAAERTLEAFQEEEARRW